MSVPGQCTVLHIFSRKVLLAGMFLAGFSIGLQTNVYAVQSPSVTAPDLVSPATASWSKSNSQTFLWSGVEDADAYALRYIKATSCTDESFVAPEVTTVATIEPTKIVDALSDGTWCWQARALNHTDNGMEVSPWSQTFSLTVDTIAPVVTVNEPHVAPEFKGTVDSTGLVLSALINGNIRTDIPVILSPTPNEAGTYNWRISIPELEVGAHMLGLRAVDQAGNEFTGYANFQLASPIRQPAGINPALTESATLPLVETGPLVFIAAPISPAITEPNSIVPYTTAQTASQLMTPAQIANPEETVKAASVSDGALQASSDGWKFFGIAWYWWAAATAGIIFLIWCVKSLVAPVQSSGLNEPRTVY